MRIRLFLILTLIPISTLLFGQEKYINQFFGFSINKPAQWIEVENEELLSNLDNFKLPGESLTKFINDHKGSILLTSYYKYNPEAHVGLIPTVQVNVRVNTTKNFREFKNAMAQSANSFKNYFEDFEFDEPPTVVKISGIETIYFAAKFTLQLESGAVTVRSRTYAIPYGSYFFQLNFTDGQDEDSSKLFDRLITTIKIVK